MLFLFFFSCSCPVCFCFFCVCVCDRYLLSSFFGGKSHNSSLSFLNIFWDEGLLAFWLLAPEVSKLLRTNMPRLDFYFYFCFVFCIFFNRSVGSGESNYREGSSRPEPASCITRPARIVVLFRPLFLSSLSVNIYIFTKYISLSLFLCLTRMLRCWIDLNLSWRRFIFLVFQRPNLFLFHAVLLFL